MLDSLRVAFWVVVAVAACHAQVAFEWDSRFARPGLRQPVVECEMHDFGTGPQLVAVVDSGSLDDHVYRLDSTGWNPLGDVLAGTVHDLQSFDAGSGPELYACRTLYNPQGSFAPIIRWTGTQWSPVGTQFLGGGGSEAMTLFDFGQGLRLTMVASSGSNSGLWTWDGSNWSYVAGSTLATISYVSELRVLDDGSGPKLYAAGYSGVAVWVGVGWQAIGLANGGVKSLTVFDDGSGAKLYAGGDFTSINGVAAAGVARRSNLLGWQALAGGPLSMSFAPNVVVNEIVVTQSPARLWIAGAFTHANGVATGPLVTWDGAAWSAAAGVIETPEAYPIADGLLATGPAGAETIYAGGNFRKIGGVAVAYVASRPVGSASWTRVPQTHGIHDGRIECLVAGDIGDGEKLYAGGTFTAIGGVSASRVARWDGTSWEALGSGITNGIQVNSLAIWNDGTAPALYVGGEFSSAGGVACSHIAKWDGLSWSPLRRGDGVDFLGPDTCGASFQSRARSRSCSRAGRSTSPAASR